MSNRYLIARVKDRLRIGLPCTAAQIICHNVIGHILCVEVDIFSNCIRERNGAPVKAVVVVPCN